MQSPHGNRSQAFRPPFMGRNGVVTSGHQLASQAGVRTMMAGGNAIDAAIATAAALGVVEPQIVRHRRRRLPAHLRRRERPGLRGQRNRARTAGGDTRTLRGDGRHPHARHAQRKRARSGGWLAAGARALRRAAAGASAGPRHRAVRTGLSHQPPPSGYPARDRGRPGRGPLSAGDLHGGRSGQTARRPVGAGGPRPHLSPACRAGASRFLRRRHRPGHRRL